MRRNVAREQDRLLLALGEIVELEPRAGRPLEAELRRSLFAELDADEAQVREHRGDVALVRRSSESR